MKKKCKSNCSYWTRWKAAVLFIYMAVLLICLFSSNVLRWLDSPLVFIISSYVFAIGSIFLFSRLSFRVGVIFVIICSIVFLIEPKNVTRLVTDLNQQMQDAFFYLRGPKKPSGQIVILEIDNRSLEELGTWPWESERLASVISYLEKDGAKVIGYSGLAGQNPLFSNLPQVYEIQGKPYGEENSSRTIRHYQMTNDNSLALSLFQKGEGFNERVVGSKGDLHGVFLKKNKSRDEKFIPLDSEGYLTLNFLSVGGAWNADSEYGKKYFLTYIPLIEVANQTVEPGFFQNKYVIIGFTATNFVENLGNPFNEKVPEVELHAIALENLISSNPLIIHEKWSKVYILTGILVGGVIITAAMAYTLASLAGLATFVLLLGIPTLSYWFLVYHHTLFNFVYPWLCLAQLSFVVMLTHFFVEGLERRANRLASLKSK